MKGSIFYAAISNATSVQLGVAAWARRNTCRTNVFKLSQNHAGSRAPSRRGLKRIVRAIRRGKIKLEKNTGLAVLPREILDWGSVGRRIHCLDGKWLERQRIEIVSQRRQREKLRVCQLGILVCNEQGSSAVCVRHGDYLFLRRVVHVNIKGNRPPLPRLCIRGTQKRVCIVFNVGKPKHQVLHAQVLSRNKLVLIHRNGAWQDFVAVGKIHGSSPSRVLALLHPGIGQAAWCN